MVGLLSNTRNCSSSWNETKSISDSALQAGSHEQRKRKGKCKRKRKQTYVWTTTTASANARNGKFFISLRLHLRLHLHFTRVNRSNANANANANARWTALVPCLCGLSSNQDGVLVRWKTSRECQKISCALRKKLQRIQIKKQEATCMEWCSKRSGARKRYAFAFGAFALTDDGRERERKTTLKHRLRPPSFISFPESSLPDCCSRVTRTLRTRLPPS